MNFFEKALAVISPRLAARRIYDRHLLRKARNFDAGNFGPRQNMWKQAGATSASAETQMAGKTLRYRSRDMRRNNGWYRRAISSITSNVIGSGIVASFQSRSAARAEQISEWYTRWAESTFCDWEGQLNLAGLQGLAMDTVAESGEALIMMRWDNNPPAGMCPLRLQVLEPDYLDPSRDLYPVNRNDNRILEGIEYDKNDRVFGYWMFEQHPGDRVSFKTGYAQSRFVPAKDVIHIFRKDRPGQGRGIPWGHSVMLLLQDLHDYQGTQLLRQKIAACFTMFIVDNNAEPDGEPEAISDKMEPGGIEVLPAGRDVKFAQPPALIGYNEYIEACLREAAAGFDITFEALTGDYSKVNFTSGRMGHIEFRRKIEAWRWTMYAPMFLNRMASRFLDGIELMGVGIDNVTVDWTAPRHELLNPKEEYESMIKAIRAGLMTFSDGLRSLGLNPRRHMAELESDFKMIDKMGLVLDIDPRKVSQQGQFQAQPTTPTTGE